MNYLEITLISLGLAMDAFAVSVCKGLAMKENNIKKALIIGAYFGIFQAIMPVIGYFLGASFASLISKLDHWVAFILLVSIGLNMIKEVFSKDDEYSENTNFKEMVILAIATSIDALVCGITFASLKTNIALASISIGVITFILSVIGVVIGKKFGIKLKNKSQILGGVILILLGIKILLEHLGIINF